MTTSQLGQFALGQAQLGSASTGGGGSPSMGATIATVRAGRTGIVVTLVGTLTTWGGGTTFTVSGSATKTAQAVANGTSATVTINALTGGGTITISDGTLSCTVTGIVATITPSPALATNGTGILISLTGSGTDWLTTTPSFTVVSGTASNITSVTVTSNTAATFNVDMPSTATDVFSDGLTQFTISSSPQIFVSRIAPFYQSATITTPVTAQLRRLVSGSWTNIGSPLTATATGVPNGYGTRIGVTPDASGGWDGVVRWAEAGGFQIEEGIFLAPSTAATTRQVTLLAPYLLTDSITAPVSAQLKQFVGGVWTNVGSPVTAVATGLTNAYGAQFTITQDTTKRWDGIVIWSDSASTPLTVSDEITIPPASSAVGGVVVSLF